MDYQKRLIEGVAGGLATLARTLYEAATGDQARRPTPGGARWYHTSAARLVKAVAS